MRRQLGWLCVLAALASSLTSTQAVIAAGPHTPSTQTFPSPGPASNSAAASSAFAASSDYGPATWNPASAANYSVANRPHDYPVQMIIIHDTEGSYADAIQEFQDPTFAASAHYVVSDAGQITQMVAEKDIAWHAGNWDYNTRAIGIEHEGYAWTCCYYTTAMYQASAQLAASICSRWGVPMDRQHVIGHDQVPDPNDPTLFGGEDHHTDPGPYWDWTYYMSLAQSYANALPSPPHLMPDPTAVLTSTTSATISWLSAQTCHSPITGYTVTGQPGNLVMNLPAGSTTATFSGLQAGVTYTFTVTATNAYGQDSLTAQWRCQFAQVSTAPSSPQLSGTTVQLSGTTAGCPNPLYQFWILAPGSSTWSKARAYSTTATFNWDSSGAAAGIYHFSLWVRDASNAGAINTSLGNFDAFVGAAYTLTTQPCTSVTATTAPHSPSVAGTAITFTGSAAGCPKPLYEFWILPPGSSTWTIAQAYSTSTTFKWSTAAKLGGTYSFSVWVRDSSSTGVTSTSLGNFDAFAGIGYTLTATPCTSVTASATPPAPSTAGTAITFTGAAAGCPSPLYQFWVLAPGSSTWTVAEAYPSSAAFNWSTAGLPVGNYRFAVWVRDSSSVGTSCNSLGCNDAFAAINYTLTSTPCLSVSASAAPASSSPAGTPVTFSGVASGCPNPLYQFWILAPGSSTWTVARAYSNSATLNWSTSGLPAGTYRFSVWARDSSSSGISCNSLGCNDTFAAINYSLTITPCTSVTASAAPPSPSVHGTAITFTGAASGCSQPLYEFWILPPGSSTWTMVQAYSTSATFSWSTTGLTAGTYRFSVWVRDSSSAGAISTSLGNFDTFIGISYTLT